jgi:hypothetical protein
MTNSFTPVTRSHGGHGGRSSHGATATTADSNVELDIGRPPPPSHPLPVTLRGLASQKLDEQTQPLIHILRLQQLLAVLGLVDESRCHHVGQHFVVIDLF